MRVCSFGGTRTVLALMMLSACLGGRAVGADDSFRDPLGSRPNASRRESASATSDRLKVTLSADKSAAGAEAGRVFVLSLALSIPDGLYTYSMNPEFTGATRVKWTKAETVGVEPLDETFTADREPHREFLAEFMQDVEKFKDGGVVWSRRYKLIDGVNLEDVRIAGKLKFQVCNRLNCTPNEEPFSVGIDSSAASSEPPAAAVPIEPSDNAVSFPSLPAVGLPESFNNELAFNSASVEPARGDAPAGELEQHPFTFEHSPRSKRGPEPVKVQFSLAPENAQPGEIVTLSVTMRIEPGWHTFAIDQNPLNTGLPTTFELLSVTGLEPIEKTFSASLMPEVEATDDGKEQRIHHKEITWSMPLEVKQPKFGVSGKMIFQYCRGAAQCRLGKASFDLGHKLKTPAKSDSPSPPEPDVDGPDGDGPAIDGKKFEPVDPDQGGSLGLYLLYAFLGGLILNVMPCVLPVIAIKVLSFVQQAGESRSRILLLNGAYSAGVIVVFLALASLAVFANFGWGNLFQETEFQIAMACIVFAMGLSLMGVFEIPVPGMIGSAAGHQHQEGPLGAFLTGIFATLLATPCSGPFLGVTLGWSVKQPAAITYLVWFVMGVGMASPYVLLGFFPGWVKFLPKPGNWMVAFKEICGFILMGTVIFLMASLKGNWLLPLLVLLLAIGFSLWMIGHLYHINSPSGRRWTVRISATLISLAGLWFAGRMADLRPGRHDLPWRAFTGRAVKAELKKGKTVFVDFTASWCLACQQNKKLAYNTAETLERVKEYDIVPFKADWTDQSDMITEWLDAFDSKSIPLAVIFPGNDPLHPIVLRDLVSKSQLLKKLDQVATAKVVAKPAVQNARQRLDKPLSQTQPISRIN